MNEPSPPPPTPWRMLLGVLFVALVVRGGAVAALHARLKEDPDAYRQMAQGLLATGVYTRDVPLDTNQIPEFVSASAFRPPLYPLLLTKLAWDGRIAPLSIGVLHVVLGLFTVALVFRLALDWGLTPWSAAGAALLVACDPILVNQSALVMTETLATLLAVACLWQLSRWSRSPSWLNALGAGVFLGLATLCRPTFLPWVGLIALAMFLLGRSWRARVLAPTVMAIGVLATLAPWGVRNYYSIDGRFLVTTTHGGYTLYLANNPEFYEYLRSGDQAVAWTPSTDEFDTHSLLANSIARDSMSGWPPGWHYFVGPWGELFEDRRYQESAKETIAAQPGMFVYSCLVRGYYLWSPLPQKTSVEESWKRGLARYLTAAWYVGVYVLALAGLWKLRWQAFRAPWIWGLTLCLAITAVHLVYWSNLRMRAPLMPVMALLAGVGSRQLCSACAAHLRPGMKQSAAHP